jgi:rubrerythrin
VPEFLNPFSGMKPGRKMTDRELARALRLSLAAEEEAIHLYEALADATSNKLAAAVLQDIANEEKEHAGEFQRLLKVLLPDEQKWLANGADEVDEMVVKLKRKARKPARKKAAAKRKK